MKTLITFILAGCFLVAQGQNIWVADNRPTAPSGAHVFANVTDAIAAASPGDIIHVIPSSTIYPDFTISKDSLTIYGIGFDPDKEQPTVAFVGNISIGTDVFGTRVSGMVVTNTFFIGPTGIASANGNIIIENCEIRGSVDADRCCSTTTLTNLIIRNCIIGNNFTSGDYVIQLRGTYSSVGSVVITNNIIMGTSSTSAGGYPSIYARDAIIKNNLFFGDGSTNDFALRVNTSTISNNIFYGRTANNSALGNTTNSTFNNNITFGANDDALPIGLDGNTGDSTLVRQDPMFVNVPLEDDWSFSFDATLMPGSPAEAPAGNDGTEIGIFGSTIPFSTSGSPLPLIRVLRVPEVMKLGDNLDTEIEAIGN